MKAVLETNVIISAASNPRGTPAKVLEAWEREEFDWVISWALYFELKGVLERRSVSRFVSWGPDQTERLLASLRGFGRWVEPATELHVMTADPDDNRVLEAALEGRVDFIVTGDRHLLELREHEGTRIVSPIQFLADLQLMR